MFLRRLFRSPTVGNIADWTTLIQLIWPFLAGSALLTWAASAIEPVMRYGWGAAFFLGLFSTCLIVLVASIGLVSWRSFRPLKPDQADLLDMRSSEGAETAAASADVLERFHSVEGQARIIFDLSEKLQKRVAAEFTRVDEYTSRLSGRLKQIEELLKPDPGQLTILGRLEDRSPPPKNKFESLEKEIARVGDQLSGARDEIVHMIGGLKGQIRSTDNQVSTTYRILATSLRARDAKEIIQKADEVVRRLGEKLIQAAEYRDDNEWRDAYNDWYKALEQIDKVAGQWTEHHKPYLGINHRDYEHAGYAAPPHIVLQNDGNSIRYKNVWIAQQQYANQRQNLLLYFDRKASELPG